MGWIIGGLIVVVVVLVGILGLSICRAAGKADEWLGYK